VLPTTIGFPILPASGPTLLDSDAFADAPGANLSTHRTAGGRSWEIPAGSWVIDHSQARPVAPGAKAVVDAGRSDVAIEADITLPSNGTITEWFSGLVLRYQDENNYVYARFLWGTPEIELWEFRNGEASVDYFSPPGFINATDITNPVNVNTTHRMKVVSVANRIAAYMDDSLIVEGITASLTGTKVEMIVDADSTAPGRFANLHIYDAAAAGAGTSQLPRFGTR
jgi:hypothetical protein